jgi:hypothetical protein
MALGEMEKTLAIEIRSQTGAQTDAASGGGGGGAGSDSKPGEKGKKDKEDGKKNDKASLGKLVGIQFGIAAMLKQSQIFTGFIGSIFQLIGMLVDVILAPLAPYLFKLVEIMASWIPIVGQMAQNTVDYLKRLFDKTVEWVDSWSTMSVSAGDLVKKGFQLVSIQGMSALIGEQFALKFGTMKGWTFTDLFKKMDVTTKTITDGIEETFTGKNAKGIKGAVGGIFKALFKALTSGWGRKLISILKTLAKGAKVLGTIGMIIGIAFEIGDIIQSFKEGKVGEAVFKIALAIIGIGVPIAIGLAFGAIPALIAGLIIAALALLWEYAVPPEIKDKVYDYITGLFKEIGDVFKEMFSLGGGSVMSKIFNAIMLVFSLPLTQLRLVMSLFLTEGVKRTINDGIRNLADTLVNGLIRFVNGIIATVTNVIPDWLPGAEKARGFQISEVDFSTFNVLMGTDTLKEQRIASAGIDLGAAGNVAMYGGPS